VLEKHPEARNSDKQMIHHISIAAENPEHVATVLAEILDGRVTPLFPDTGTYAAWSKDDYGTAVEVYPYGFTMQPGEDHEPVDMVNQTRAAGFSESHAAISVALDTDALLAIAARENWRAMEHNRGPFRVVEFWLENKVLIEFFTPEMKKEYTSAVTSFARGEWE
jgi:hypothetical protein